MTLKSRNPAAPKLSSKDKRERFVKLFADGVGVEEAARVLGCSPKTHEYYMKTDETYRQNVLAVRATQGRREHVTEVPDFGTFRSEFLGRGTYVHQKQWIDLLEGDTPASVHPSMTLNVNDPDWIIINTPPEHAKSTTITVDYVIWKICQDPNFRVVIVSETRDMAKKFLYQIQTVLTHSRYAKLHAAFAPPGGFKADADSWTSDRIYLGQGMRDSGEKDPTIQALGMGQQIYGARADLIVLDDCVVLRNAHEFEKQITWIQQEVITRPSSRGRILVVGTRVAPQDLYSELQNPRRYPDNESPWTYFAQPAVLEYHEDPTRWVTLWPRTDMPCGCRKICQGDVEPDRNGLFPKWDGLHLSRRRGVLQSSTWARVYMQANVAEDQVFRPECVNAAVNGQRLAGPLIPNAVGHPEHGGDGHYRIGSMDPAMAGHTAAVVYSVDRGSHKRYVLDVHDQAAMTPLGIRQLIKTWTVRYGLNEWRIEGNAFQNYLAQDQDLKDWLSSRGCVLNPHITGRNKWDPDFGVASLAPLFGDVDKDTGVITRPPMIDLPSPKRNEAIKRLVEQFITWQPERQRGRNVKTDIVMAVWFAEIRAREILSDRIFTGTHVENRYVPPYAKRQQYSVNLDEVWTAKQLGLVDDSDVIPLQPVNVELPVPWR